MEILENWKIYGKLGKFMENYGKCMDNYGKLWRNL